METPPGVPLHGRQEEERAGQPYGEPPVTEPVARDKPQRDGGQRDPGRLHDREEPGASTQPIERNEHDTRDIQVIAEVVEPPDGDEGDVESRK